MTENKRPWTENTKAIQWEGTWYVVDSEGRAVAELCGDNAESDARIFAAASELYEALKAYEQWEADLITDDEAWAGGMAPFPTITGPLHDRMMDIQAMRTTALRAANPDAFDAESKGE